MTSLSPVCKSGVSGLDEILGGGFPRDCLYLIEGNPGVGKTTLAMQFLLEGLENDEICLYVTLSETQRELAMVAESHGWDLSGLATIDYSYCTTAVSEHKASSVAWQHSRQTRLAHPLTVRSQEPALVAAENRANASCLP